MFPEPPKTKDDLRQSAVIQQKQRIENERKARIFNPRDRMIGLDCDGLAQQLAEKKELDEQAAALEQKHVAEQRKNDQLLNQKAHQLEAQRARVQREDNQFREQHQRKEQTREFDLNDPEYKRKSVAARIGDDDPRLTASGAQKFEGEDIAHDERMRRQQGQQRAWLQQQMREKTEAKADTDNVDRLMLRSMQTHDQRARELKGDEQRLRRQVDVANAQYNRAMADEQRGRRERERHEEEKDNAAEKYNNLTSEMLLESKDLAGSNFGGNRKITTMYRGMTDEQLAVFQQQKQCQLEEQKRIQDEQRVNEERYVKMVRGFDRSAVLNDRKRTREYQRQMTSDMQENLKLAEEQKAKKDHLKKTVYTNSPTEDYFAQFNTTSR